MEVVVDVGESGKVDMEEAFAFRKEDTTSDVRRRT